MTNELEVVQNKGLVSTESISDETLKNYLVGTSSKFTDSQITLFMGIAKASNLNPFKKEIYAVPYEKNVLKNGQWEKVLDITIVTGYQVYIDRAISTGLLDGWDVQLTEAGAEITIYRKDWKMPFKWEVEMKEFKKLTKDGKPMGAWGTMPNFLIKKVAIGQGFRLCFPNVLGGLPYLQEEVPPVDEDEVSAEDKQAGVKTRVKTVGVSKVKEEPVVVDAVVEETPTVHKTVDEYIEDKKEEVATEVEEKKAPVKPAAKTPAAKPAPVKEEAPAESKADTVEHQEEIHGKLSFDTIVAGIAKKDPILIENLRNNMHLYSGSTQAIIFEQLKKAGIEIGVADTAPAKPAPVAKKEEATVSVEDVTAIFEGGDDITIEDEPKGNPKHSEITELFRTIHTMTKSTALLEVFTKSNIDRQFGKKLEELDDTQCDRLITALKKKIDTLSAA